MISRLSLLPILVAALLASPGCGGSSQGKAGGPPARPAPMVEGLPAEAGSLEETVTLNGHLSALHRGEVTARTTGRVARVAVREGDRVNRGEPVIWLETHDLEADVAQAAAALEAARARLSQSRTGAGFTGTEVDVGIHQARMQVLQAESQTARAQAEFDDAANDLKRQRELFGDDAIPKITLERAELRYKNAREALQASRSAERAAREALSLARAGTARADMQRSEAEGAAASVLQAEAALQAARVRLGETVMAAPISGVVVKRSVDPGQAVSAQSSTPLLVIVDNSALELVAPMDERFAAEVRPGQAAQVSSSLYPGVTFSGKVVEVVPAADPTTHSVPVRIRVDEEGRNLIDGAYVSARLPIRTYEGIIVPRDSVQVRTDETYVVVLEGEKVRKAAVKVLFRDEEKAVVAGEVAPGQVVITAGAEGLADGQAVRLHESGGSPAP